MADEHETESKAWAIEAAAAEAASRAAEEVHRPPVVPMERVVDRDVIERGERAGRKRSQEPGFPRFFAELNLGLILTAFAIVAFKTPNWRHRGRVGHSVHAVPDPACRRFYVDYQCGPGRFGLYLFGAQGNPVERLCLVCAVRLCLAV